MQYEIFYLVGASKEGELDNIKNEIEKIVKDSGGVFLEKETQEKRRLSYQVKRDTHGIYIAKRFELENNENIKEITGKMNLNGNILRFIISKASELPELKSKEERMNVVSRKETVIEKAKTETKPILQKTETQDIEKMKEKTEEIAPKEEDIDKKLEEILNI